MEDDAQLDELLELVSRMGADDGMPGYRELVHDRVAARERGDRQAEASLGLSLGMMLTAAARTVAAIGSAPGFPDVPMVNDRAIAELTAALSAAEAAGDAGSARFALLQLADCHLRGASPAQARPFLEQLIDRCDAPDNAVLRYEAVSRLGDCDVSVGDPASALESYETALRLAEAIGDPAEQASQLGKLGSTFAALGQPVAALDRYGWSRALWVRIRDDTAVRGRVTLHAGLLEPGVDPIISDLDERIAAQEHALRLADSRAKLTPRQECHYRIASHSLNLMTDLGGRWHSPGERAAAQAAFDEEWGLVRHNQEWAAEHAGEIEVAAELCLAFATAGRSLLDSRVAPADRLRWTRAGLAVADTRGDREAQANVCVNLANDEFDLGYVETAHEHADRAYRLAQELNHDDVAGNALITLSQVQQLRGQFDLAHETLEHGRRLLGDSPEADRFVSNQAALYSAAGDFGRAVELGARDLEEAVREKDRSREASALANLGIAHHGLGDFGTALSYEMRAIALFRDLGDRRSEVEVLANCAATHVELGDFDEAERSLRESLARARESGYRQGEEGALGNLAVVLRNLGRFDEAASAFTAAMEIARDRGHLTGQAAALHGLASVELQRGDHDAAAELFQRSLDIGRDIKHRDMSAKAALGLGQTAIARGDFGGAFGMLDESLALAREAGNRLLEASAVQALAVAAAGLGRYDQARAYAADARAIAEAHGYADVVGMVDRLLSRLPSEEGGRTQDVESQLYESAMRAAPYLRRDGVRSYADMLGAATGEAQDALLSEAESGMSLFNELLDTAADEEKQQMYSLMFAASVRRAAAEVASSGSVPSASLSDERLLRVLGILVAIRASVRFPEDLATVIEDLGRRQDEAGA